MHRDQQIDAAPPGAGHPSSERQRAERELLAANELLERRSQELQQQREWFEVALASIGDAVITCDGQGRITFLNPVAENLTGWSRAETCGRRVDDLFRVLDEQTRAEVENPVSRVLQTGQAVALANHSARLDRRGIAISIEDSAAPIRDGNGNMTGAVMVFHDVTERRRIEVALAASEERFRGTFNQAAVGIVIASMDYRYVEVNQCFCDLLGYTPDELRQLSVLDVTHPDDRASTGDQVTELRRGDRSHYSMEKRYLRKNGSSVWCRTTVTVLEAAADGPQYFLGIVDDISDRREGEEARSRLAAVVESSDDAIVTKTLDGIVTTWNRGAQRLFGYEAEEMIGKPITLLIPPEHSDEEPAILEKLRRGEPVDHYETVRVRKDGSRFDVSLTVSPIFNARGEVIGASKIARDISRSKQVENTLRASDRRKDDFLATLAHELRNPLAPIKQAAVISKSAQATETQKRWSYDVIERQVGHMALLLDDLLDISRVTRGILNLRVEMTDLATVVDSAVETARPVIHGKQHQLIIDLPPEPLRFAGDPLRLAQIFSNLLTNAAKYTPAQGRIVLRGTSDEKQITVSVTDTGIGIPPESLSGLFTMFSQVHAGHQAEGGLGIGLALSKGLVDLHGGTIEARSEGTGRGSEFVVRLPRRSLPGFSGSILSTDPTPLPAWRRRVVVADDNVDAADSLAVLLRLDGHDVHVVHDGRSALDAILAERPDCALLDIGMPVLNGYEVARQVRQSASGNQVLLIAVTGWGQDRDKAEAAAAGFNQHFTKPLDPTRVLDMLNALPARSRP